MNADVKTNLLVTTLFLAVPLNAYAELTFDISALEKTGNGLTDISRQQLAQVDRQLPGTYIVDVILNGEKISSEEMTFVDCNDRLCPVISLTQLANWGVSTAGLDDPQAVDAKGKLREPLSALIPGAATQLTSGISTFLVTVPQKYLQGRDDASRLSSVEQNGMPALFMSYYYSGQRDRSQEQGTQDQHFLNLNNGLNIGPWRVRQNAYLEQSQGGQPHWRSDQTFIGRDIMSLMSRLMVGQVSTAGRVFDSFAFRGLTLTSIDDMLSDSQRNYAPVISGIALTQATVEIRQNGNLIYQKSVPPGPFAFEDVVANNSSGDLVVTVRESSGEVRTFIQPYATQPKMVRKGQLRYAASSGQYENSEPGADKELFTQLEALYGLTNVITLFGGALGSQTYQSAVSGLGLNLGDLGGISFEIDASRTQPRQEQITGTGYASKINYQKFVEATKTTLNTSLTESFDRRYTTYSDYQTRYGNSVKDTDQIQAPRRRWQMSLSQDLGDVGSLSLNYYIQKSWNDRFQTKTLNTSYSTYWKGVSANVTYSRSDIVTGRRYKDDVLAFNVSIPLSTLWGSPGQAQINHNYSRGRDGYAQNQTTVNGTLLPANNLNYSLSKTWTRQQSGEAARVQYDGGYGSVNAGWSQTGQGNTQLSFGSSGAVVIHPHGVTFGQNISSTDAFAIVSAPGARDVAVTTKSGVSTDWRGYAIVPSLSAYRRNSIALDAKTAGEKTTLKSTEVQAVPGFGTAINAQFATSIGRKAYVKLRYRNQPMPLGTELKGNKGGYGLVDEKGAAWLTGLADNEVLTAQVNGATCTLSIDEQQLTLTNGIYTGTRECR